MLDITNGMLSQVVAGIARGRNMTEEQVQNILKNPLLSREAAEQNLVDGLRYQVITSS